MNKLIATALLASGLTFAQPNFTPRHVGQHNPVIGKPFSGTEIRHSTQTFADGNRVENVDSSSYYRDAYGRVRSEGKNVAMIFDPVAGFQYRLDSRNKTYTKTAFDPKSGIYSFAVVGDSTWTSHTTTSTTGTPGHGSMVHTRTVNGRPVADSKPVTEDLQPQVVNGMHSRGKRTTTTIPMGAFGNDREIKVVNEQWSSDDLQVLVKSTNSDPRFGVTSYELANIVQNPPDPALFQIPSDYKEGTEHHTAHHE
jgi:hypothetical protein